MCVSGGVEFPEKVTFWGPNKSALIAALHCQLRRAAMDAAAKDNAAKKKSIAAPHGKRPKIKSYHRGMLL